MQSIAFMFSADQPLPCMDVWTNPVVGPNID